MRLFGAAGSGSIHGEVIDGVTGAPIAQAQVTVRPLKGDGQPLETSTGVDGRFLLADVPAGEWVCWARKPGYLPRPHGLPKLRGAWWGLLHVRAKQSLHVHRALTPESVLLGRVLAPGGKPLDGAYLTLFSVPYPGARPRPSGSTISTNHVGEFQFPLLAAGSVRVEGECRPMVPLGQR